MSEILVSEILIDILNISKAYGGVRALDDVSMQIANAQIHGLCGENGAGKSTLIKILTGVVTPDAGQILVNDCPLATGNVQNSEAAGIAVMHQESTAFPDLNAVDNLFVGREITHLGGLLLDRSAMRTATRSYLQRLGEDIRIDQPVGQLTVAQRQMVAMARALSQNCRLLIMDEPTASLSSRETETLFRIMNQLREEGVSILYVTHRLDEIFRITDRVTVFRDGRRIDTFSTSVIDRQILVQTMIGKQIDESNRKMQGIERDLGQVRLQVESLQSNLFRDISFSVRAGEIVGFAGLVGAGRSEATKAVFGIDSYDSGRVLVDGQPVARNSVQAAMHAGIAFVPEDRQHEGLILPMSIGSNISLAVLKSLRRMGMTNVRREQSLVDEQLKQLQVKLDNSRVPAETLSGGNQQKLVLGKWLATNPKALILDEPTRGVDVGAKAQIYEFIGLLAASGIAIVVISSDMEEVLQLSHRILVFREGEISGELSGVNATQERILQLALPVENTDTASENGLTSK